MNARICLAVVASASLGWLLGCQEEIEPMPVKPAPTSSTSGSGTNHTVTPPVASAPDNTANNKADASGDTMTPFDQSEASGDIKITATIRRGIMDDTTLSMSAQNCKVITDKAQVVTLRGVVANQAEKERIGAIAAAVTGVTRVDNQLEIKAG